VQKQNLTLPETTDGIRWNGFLHSTVFRIQITQNSIAGFGNEAALQEEIVVNNSLQPKRTNHDGLLLEQSLDFK
jgi:hypothetical protein